MHCPNFIFRIELISPKTFAYVICFFLQMHCDNKLFFYIIKMETLYFHAKQNLLFLKCLFPLSLKYSKTKSVADSRCPEPLDVKLSAHVAVSGFNCIALKLLHMEGSARVTTSLMHSQKAGSAFVGYNNGKREDWKLFLWCPLKPKFYRWFLSFDLGDWSHNQFWKLTQSD